MNGKELKAAFEVWWEQKGWDGDNPSAMFTPADDYSKFDFGMICFKAGFDFSKKARSEAEQDYAGLIKEAREKWSALAGKDNYQEGYWHGKHVGLCTIIGE